MTLKHPQTTPLRHLFYVSTKLATGTRYLANSLLTEKRGVLVRLIQTRTLLIITIFLNLFLLAHFLF